jgi:hypothetical protein
MRPEATEYAPYFEKYVSLVPEGDIAETLAAQLAQTLTLWRSVPEELGRRAYAPGKWSIKEMMGHVIDTERIMAYRALRIARGDQTPLPGFEQDGYIANSNFNARTIADLADEFEAVRRANVHLIKHLSAEELQRRGTASENSISARALAYIIAGHELYHQDLLKTRYLAGAAQ